MKITNYDVEALLAAADIREIARQLGAYAGPVFCQCPTGHPETQYNHCSVHKDYYHCFSCGAAGDAISYVREYYTNVLGQTLTFLEACEIIGDMFGGHELYALSPSKTGRRVEKPPFSKDELSVLGLTQANNKDDAAIRINSLFAQNRTLYFTIIRERSLEMLDKTNALFKMLGNTSFEEKLKLELNRRKSILLQAYKKAGGAAVESKSVPKMFSL